MTAQLLLQPSVGQRRLPCSQQEELCCLCKMLCALMAHYNWDSPCLKLAAGCTVNAEIWVGVQVFSWGFIHSVPKRFSLGKAPSVSGCVIVKDWQPNRLHFPLWAA